LEFEFNIHSRRNKKRREREGKKTRDHSKNPKTQRKSVKKVEHAKKKPNNLTCCSLTFKQSSIVFLKRSNSNILRWGEAESP
jgi:hypothetical protein